ncbi:nucleotide exchange factor GrpE [Duganella sp. FT135W]|uniref:Protein GrpE n=1 Tax=Duganella flavida TaxID=2692175 RepID=A0A6L8K8K6_9BURK|nr:nucleotide exchange factor GrpE [Duganella flavida]MYM23500.1 nucleotide exchange factor GrpE [Duganella flavida]
MQDQENQAVPPNPEAAEAAASAQPSTPEAGLPSLEQQLAGTEAKLADMHDAFMRAKADGENIRRRAQEDVSKAHKFAVESFAEALVPVKDSLEMALKVEAPTLESLKEGVEMTLKQLSAAFERNRLIAIEPAQGEKLDPNKHQAVAVVPADQEANTVVAVLQKGYMIADRLLRPAIVTAAQAK